MKSSPFVVMLLAGGLVAAPPCRATNHLIQLNEVMAGCGGDPRIQFVEVVFPPTQNQWGGCAELAFFDATGAQTASFPFPSDVPDDHRDGNSALIATQAFADLPGAPRPDFLIPSVIQAPGGKLCFRGNQPEPCLPVDICLSYGAFRGDTAGAGRPAPALPLLGPLSLRRFRDSGFGDGTQFNGDFVLASPIPRNNQGAAGIVVETPGGCRVDPACPTSDLGSPSAVSLSGTTRGEENLLVASCGGDDAPESTFLYTAPRTGSYTIDSRGSTTDTVLYVLDGSCEGAELACNDDFVGRKSRVVVPLVAGQQIVVAVEVAQASGNFVLNIVGPPPDCGNGVVERGEECDDGNTFDGDCCSATCRFEPSGSPCADDGDPCTQDRCTGAGTCAHEPCNVCSACDPVLGCVAAPALGCVQPPRGGASLVVTDSRDDGRDRIVWKWMSSTPTDKLDFGAPLTTTDYGLCVYEMRAAPALKLEATAPADGLCAGQPCWKETTAGFKYKDKALTPDGVAAIELKAGATPGKSSIRVKGKGPRLGLPPSFASPLSVQLRKSDGATCWEATYSRIVQSGNTIKAKAD